MKIVKVYEFDIRQLLSKGILVYAVPTEHEILEVKTVDDIHKLILVIQYEESPEKHVSSSKTHEFEFTELQIRYYRGHIVNIHDETYVTTIRPFSEEPIVITKI